jgi:hypothetical protein
MIDLKKLEERFEAFFETETEESFNKWFDDKKKREAMALLGIGCLETLETDCPTEFVLQTKQAFIQIIEDDNFKHPGNTQYAMAA